MISRQLDRITLQQHVAIDEVAQALALTYLAYYNADAMQPRVLEAYKRAWAFDTLQQFARTGGGDPGFNVAMWTGEGIKQIHIAIEGTTNVAQLLPHSGGSAWTAGALFTGSPLIGVVTNFYTQANAIHARLLADPVIGPKLTDPRWVITCTGHSLGAACADYLSYKIKLASANQRVRLIKFGSPRVGNTRYVNDRERMVVTKSVYCGRDPIHVFPTAGTGGLVGRVLFPLMVPANPAIEDVPYLMRRGRPTWSAGLNPEVNQYAITYVRALASGFPPNSAWYDHTIKSYRLAMLSLCGQQRDMLMYRFRYLEHNDENRWQEGWGPGLDVWAGLDALGLGVVGDAAPITGEVEEIIETIRPRQEAIVSAGAPLDNPPETPMWAPVGFPALSPSETFQLPRRRFARPRPAL